MINFFRKKDSESFHSYTPKYFNVCEFVSRDMYNLLGDDSLLTMDIRIVMTADLIREYFDVPIIINSWRWGGLRNWSGLRTNDSPYYKKTSQHSFGRAIDFISPNMSAKNMRNTILENPKEPAFKYITGVEDFDGMDWVHVDCRNLNKKQNRYLVFGK